MAYSGIAKDQVESTKEFLENIIASSVNAIITTDMKGIITFFSKGAEELMGYNASEVIGIPVSELYVRGRIEAKRVMRLLREQDSVKSYETTIKSRDGGHIPISLSASYLRNDKHEIIGMMGVSIDGRDKKRLEEKIRDREQYLATITTDSADAIIGLDTEGRIISWNRGASEIFGFQSQEVIGEHYSILVGEQSASREELGWIEDQVELRGYLRNFEAVRRTKNGKEVYVEITRTAIRDENGASRGSSVIMRDITERKRLEDKLKKNISQLSVLHEIVKSLQSTIKIEDLLRKILIGVTAGQALGFNRAFLLLINPENNRLEGKLAVGPSDREEAGRLWHELQKKEMSLQEIMDSYTKVAKESDIAVNQIVKVLNVPLNDCPEILAKPIREKRACKLDAWSNDVCSTNLDLSKVLGVSSFAVVPLISKDEVIGLIIVDDMITGKPIEDDQIRQLEIFAGHASTAIENSRLYRKLEEKVEALEIVNCNLKENQQKLLMAERLSALGELAMKVAHEIRNPLVSIGGFAKAVTEKLSDDDPNKEYMKIVVEESVRMENILTEILDFSKTARTEFETTEFNRVVTATYEMIKNELAVHDIKFETRLADNLPPVMIDANQVRQVLLNLFRNAMDAMPEGGIITISTNLKNQFLQAHVSDTGTGISKEVLSNLFSPFFTTKSTGSGLGLTVVSQIIEDHKGSIFVTSGEGTGSTFTINLPVYKGE